MQHWLSVIWERIWPFVPVDKYNNLWVSERAAISHRDYERREKEEAQASLRRLREIYEAELNRLSNEIDRLGMVKRTYKRNIAQTYALTVSFDTRLFLHEWPDSQRDMARVVARQVEGEIATGKFIKLAANQFPYTAHPSLRIPSKGKAEPPEPLSALTPYQQHKISHNKHVWYPGDKQCHRCDMPVEEVFKDNNGCTGAKSSSTT